MPTLNWIGKDKIVNHHNDVPFRVLEKKYTFGNDSENMIIHGDNLEALKALLPKYENRIKCIYIDPPYNTGNEHWVYNDNVNDPHIQKWLNDTFHESGITVDDLTRHDKWLCMMYPRLVLLEKLLHPEGAIFISIDDNEQANLKLMCDEIFGGNNFVALFPVKRQGGRQDSKYYAVIQEYMFCYTKTNCFESGKEVKEKSNYPKFDKSTNRYYKTQLLRKWGSNSLRENRPNLYYPIKAPDGVDVYPTIYKKTDNNLMEIEGRWRWGMNTMHKAIENNMVEFQQDSHNNWIPYEKIFAPLTGENETKKYTTWIDNIGNGTSILNEIFEESVFDYPKSVDLLERVIKMANTDPDSIILDSFAGSGTTAHAVLNLNKQDGGNRKFILVEMCDYAENITAERVRRVINGYGDTEGSGGGFNFYELGTTIFNTKTGLLNNDADNEKIREYVWFAETHTPYSKTETSNRYFLGSYDCADYYFYYEKEQETTLDWDFLYTITQKSEKYIIYADRCLLSESEMQQHNIVFKKIPRDIKKL